MKYTPLFHTVLMVKKYLGCEEWEPSFDLLNRLRKDLPSDSYGNRLAIRSKLTEWEERSCYGHETRIACTLMGTSPTVLTPEDKNDLKIAFNEWWESLRRAKPGNTLSDFVEDWVKENVCTNLKDNSTQY